MRTLWKGVISFGLVTIPIRLYSAAESRAPKFRYLHASCLAPIQYRKVCSSCGQEVPREEIQYGYEYEKDHFMPLSTEELKELEPEEGERAVEILRFVPAEDLDPVYFLKPYYVEPMSGGAKAYQLLREAMVGKDRVAVCKLRLRAKTSLAVLRSYHHHALVLETMHDPDEIRQVEDLEAIKPLATPEKEKELAGLLIDALSTRFDPLEHPSDYRAALEDLIARKVAEGVPLPEPATKAEQKAVDLMDVLKASLSAARKEEKQDERLPAYAGSDR